MRIGIGYDSHRLVAGRRLVIGGVEIPFPFGLLGHSDGDALCHAIIDALLGAMGKGDIGCHFPDTEATWKDAKSTGLLKYVVDLCTSEKWHVAWIDTIIIAEKPKLAPYIASMKEALMQAGLSPAVVNIKVKTDEGMGFVGRGEGIAVHAVCLLTHAS